MGFQMDESAVKSEEVEVSDLGLLGYDEDVPEVFNGDKTTEGKPEQGEKEDIDQAAIYRYHGIELFEKREYEQALVEFTKVLNAHPKDPIALEYSYKYYFQNAMTFFENKDYLLARDQFQECLRYKHDCKECRNYIETSETLYKELHYKRGMQYYDKELLHEAIEEWELVRAIDPNYKMTGHLIDKSKRILEKIEEIKKSQAKGR
jgi:tetratricopeptide (TPR) repeat protein